MWYSICIVYNASKSGVMLTINGYETVNILDYKHMGNKPVNIESEFWIGGCKKDFESFIGSLTEFNGWNRKVDYFMFILCFMFLCLLL